MPESQPDSTSANYPPGLADPTAESEVIGGLLRTPKLVPAVVALIESADAFTQPRLGAAYRAIATAFNRGEEPTPARIRGIMRDNGDSDPSLATWLVDLHASAPPLPADVTIAAETVRSHAAKRNIDFTLRKALARVSSVEVDDTEAVTEIHGSLTALLAGSQTGDSLHAGGDVLMETVEKIEEAGRRDGLPGLSTGSRDLDDVLQGLRPGQLIVVGGRPAVGKSMVVCDLFRQIAHQGVGAMLFSLEMTRHDITKRIFAAEAAVDYRHILRGQLTEDEWGKVGNVVSAFPSHNISIVDDGGLTVEQIAALATQQVRLWQAAGITPGAILIDYLQIAGTSKQYQGNASRQQAIGHITRELKALAKRLEVSIVVLSQVGRGSEGKTDKVPLLSDLRESGDIENDADVVILLHRPDYYDPEDRPGEIDFIVAKNREGVTRTVTRITRFRYSRIDDMAHAA